MIVVVSGHRPRKLGGCNLAATIRLQVFAVESIREIHEKQRIDCGISGMAPGWDQACAFAFSKLEIPWVAAVPCLGQEMEWTEEAQKTYRYILNMAASVEQVSNQVYAPGVMDKRNRWLVDQIREHDILLALWDGTASGTGNCVAYARRLEKKVVNIWSKWIEFQRRFKEANG